MAAKEHERAKGYAKIVGLDPYASYFRLRLRDDEVQKVLGLRNAFALGTEMLKSMMAYGLDCRANVEVGKGDMHESLYDPFSQLISSPYASSLCSLHFIIWNYSLRLHLSLAHQLATSRT